MLQARSTLRTASNNLIRALSINPRFPVGEIERIKNETNLDPSLVNSPEAMRADMIALDRSLRLRADQELRDSRDQQLSTTSRANARKAASDINNFLAQLGAPEEIDASMLTIDSIDRFDRESLQRFINTSTEAQLNALPSQVGDLLLKRIESGR